MACVHIYASMKLGNSFFLLTLFFSSFLFGGKGFGEG